MSSNQNSQQQTLNDSMNVLQKHLTEHLQAFDRPEHFHVWSGVSPDIAENELHRSIANSRQIIANFLEFSKKTLVETKENDEESGKSQLQRYMTCLKDNGLLRSRKAILAEKVEECLKIAKSEISSSSLSSQSSTQSTNIVKNSSWNKERETIIAHLRVLAGKNFFDVNANQITIGTDRSMFDIFLNESSPNGIEKVTLEILKTGSSSDIYGRKPEDEAMTELLRKRDFETLSRAYIRVAHQIQLQAEFEADVKLALSILEDDINHMWELEKSKLVDQSDANVYSVGKVSFSAFGLSSTYWQAETSSGVDERSFRVQIEPFSGAPKVQLPLASQLHDGAWLTQMPANCEQTTPVPLRYVMYISRSVPLPARTMQTLMREANLTDADNRQTKTQTTAQPLSFEGSLPSCSRQLYNAIESSPFVGASTTDAVSSNQTTVATIVNQSRLRINVDCGGEPALAVRRLPFLHAHQLPGLVALLRQHHTFNTLIESCFKRADDATAIAASGGVQHTFEVAGQAPHRIVVHFVFNEQLSVLNVDIAVGGRITCALPQSIDTNNNDDHDQKNNTKICSFIAQLLQTVPSLPHAFAQFSKILESTASQQPSKRTRLN